MRATLPHYTLAIVAGVALAWSSTAPLVSGRERGATSAPSAARPTIAVDAKSLSHASPRARHIHVRFTNEGPLPNFLTPLCQQGRCVIPATGTGVYHGDLEGIHISSTSTAIGPSGTRFAIARTDVFIGTVKGCGNGTFVARGTEDATPTTGTGSGDIAVGFGTGDLAHLAGHYGGTGTAGPTGIRSSLSGDFTCTR